MLKDAANVLITSQNADGDEVIAPKTVSSEEDERKGYRVWVWVWVCEMR